MGTTATGFDDATAALEAIVARCRATDDRAGYFPAMYLAVTRTVRRRASSGRFEDPDRMERFVSAFAARYLDARADFEAGRRCPQVWQAAFEAAGRRRPIILQHLLLGINAHINLDLGVTAAAAGGAGPLEAVQADFDAVNDVLAELVDGCQAALDEVSPWLHLVDHIGGRHDEALVRFSLVAARRQAWRVARRVHGVTGPARAAAIDAVDVDATHIADLVRHPGIPASALLLVVRVRERAAPREVIDLLAAVQPSD